MLGGSRLSQIHVMIGGRQWMTVSSLGRGHVVKIGPERSVITANTVFGMTMVFRSLKVNSHKL